MWKQFVNNTVLPVTNLAITIEGSCGLDPDAWAPQSTFPGISPKGPLQLASCRTLRHCFTTSPCLLISNLLRFLAKTRSGLISLLQSLCFHLLQPPGQGNLSSVFTLRPSW
ncbi:hypothetical protein HJG60_017991 [Phyllostomus discolor]|uniref:Uncharacterized protein n=1 Tax=Phyllostomus discolor TaxID=89673 RepID=A0A834ESB2_9CHIR|nr:hypothetical protein HJG60_017991 [Phyllostomus discolor]